ncbi:unnamed protein product [Caretta caretta]
MGWLESQLEGDETHSPLGPKHGEFTASSKLQATTGELESEDQVLTSKSGFTKVGEVIQPWTQSAASPAGNALC